MGNWYFARKFLHASLITLSILMLIGCQSPEEEAKDHLKKGKELLEKGDYAAAKLELKNAAQADKNISDTYYSMALLDEKNRNIKSMRENLKKTLKIDPENIEARVKLGKVYLLYDEVDSALIQADKALEQESKNTNALLLKASVQLRQKKQDEALSIIDSVLAADFVNTEALSLKLLVLMENEDFNQALILLDRAMQAEPDNLSLHLLKVQLDANREDMDAVIRDYEQLVQMYPGRLDFSYNLAGIYIHEKRKEDAERLLLKLVSDNPEKLRPKLVLLTFLNNHDEARALTQLQEYLDQYKGQPKILFQFIQWMIASGKNDNAETTLKQIVEQEPDSQFGVSARILLAKLALQSKDLGSSLSIINKVIKERPEYQEAILLKARIVFQQGETDKAIVLLKSVLLMNPNSDEALVMLAQAYTLQGDTVSAKKYYRRAFEINPGNLQAVMAEYNRAMKKKNLKNANNILEKALRVHPGNIGLQHKLAQIRIAEKNWVGAQEIITGIGGKPNAKLLADFLQGKIYQEQGNYQEAIEIYKELLKVKPNNAGVLNAMAACYEALNNRQDMLAYLSFFIKENPTVNSAYLLESRLLQLENKFSEAITVINQVISNDDRNIQAYAQLANIYIAMGKESEALAVYRSGLKKNPNSVRLSLLMASFYERSQEYAKAVAIYENLIEKNPKLDVSVSNLATILTDHYGDEENIKRARLLAGRFKNSDQPFFSDTYAWTELKAGNVKEVIKIFKKNVLLVPDLPVFKYHLGVAYHQMGNNGAAIAELNQAINLGATHEFVEIASARQLMKEIKGSR